MKEVFPAEQFRQEKSLSKVRSLGFTIVELLIVLCIIGVISGIIFSTTNYVFDLQDRKKAASELAYLKAAAENYKAKYGNYPHCPMKVCDPGECFLLALMGYHNGKGKLQFPPFPNLVNPTLFDYGPNNRDPAILNALANGGSQASKNLIAIVFNQDINFCDPWGTPYAYEFPRQDGIGGFRLYSSGPDGKTGKDHSGDDIQ
jgi:prepilin-type N-terminal cleavage/methylation domain-containing protein